MLLESAMEVGASHCSSRAGRPTHTSLLDLQSPWHSSPDPCVGSVGVFTPRSGRPLPDPNLFGCMPTMAGLQRGLVGRPRASCTGPHLPRRPPDAKCGTERLSLFPRSLLFIRGKQVCNSGGGGLAADPCDTHCALWGDGSPGVGHTLNTV